MEFQEIIGITLKKIRKKKNISQESLAFKVGLHRTYIGAVERGERNITLKNLYKIIKSLDISLVDFFKEVESEIEKKSNK